MAMAKTPIGIDQEALAIAAEVLGTKTKKDTVNAALHEVGQRLVRLRALAGLGEMADVVTSMSSSAPRPHTGGEPRHLSHRHLGHVPDPAVWIAEGLVRSIGRRCHRDMPDRRARIPVLRKIAR
jgi:Arc/MetJ family transcription regulator